MDWQNFFNEDHSIYVNARHRAVHAALVAQDISAMLPDTRPRVLDWGCGEAEGAGDVAARCATLYLYDSAPRVRDNLRERFAKLPEISVLDEAELAALPPRSLDVVIIVSVLQYLTPDVFADTLRSLQPKIAIGGRLIIGDVVPPGLSPVVDAKALLILAVRNGFFLAAVAGLVRTFFSQYRRLRGTLGLTQWSEDAILGQLRAHGFEGARAARNIGHNQARMTFDARRVA